MNKLSWLVAVMLLLLGMEGCGGGTSKSDQPATLASMAGSWDFALTSSGFANGDEVLALGTILAQDNSGNISASGPATANGPSGNVLEVFLTGSSLSNVTNMGIDFLGAACGGNDNGIRMLAGTINSSNQVTINFARGGAQMVTITGTLNASATPSFSGTFKISAPGCGSDGTIGNVAGVPASSLTGNYAGSPYNSADNVTFSLTAGANNTFSGNGTDSQNGAFTLSGNSVGNAASVTNTPSGGGNATSFFTYYDPQLGAKGSVVTLVFVGANATSCPNGAPLPTGGGGCLFGIFAKQ